MTTTHDRAISGLELPVAAMPIYGCTGYPDDPFQKTP